MLDVEYLVSYGRSGDFGRFRPEQPLRCRRGDRVVIRTDRGVEIGEVLCPGTPGHAGFLSHSAVGGLLRQVTPDDEEGSRRRERQSHRIFEHARRLADEMALPLEVIDVEVLFDGQLAVVYHLRREECDYRPLVSSLSRAFELRVIMENLALPVEAEAGCGRPDCGQKNGGCNTCGSGGGCGTCGKGLKPEDVGQYLAGLQQQFRSPRTSLL